MTYNFFQTGSLLRVKGYIIWMGHWDNRCKPGLFQENQDTWSLPTSNILFSRLSHSSLNVSRYFFPLEYSDLYSQSLSCLGTCFLLLLEWILSIFYALLGLFWFTACGGEYSTHNVLLVFLGNHVLCASDLVFDWFWESWL